MVLHKSLLSLSCNALSSWSHKRQQHVQETWVIKNWYSSVFTFSSFFYFLFFWLLKIELWLNKKKIVILQYKPHLVTTWMVLKCESIFQKNTCLYQNTLFSLSHSQSIQLHIIIIYTLQNQTMQSELKRNFEMSQNRKRRTGRSCEGVWWEAIMNYFIRIEKIFIYFVFI